MLENETKLGHYTVQRPCAYDQLGIIFPGRSDAVTVIMLAQDFSAVPPLSDALPKTGRRRPYAFFKIREIQSLPSQVPAGNKKQTDHPLKFLACGLVLPNMDQVTNGENTRGMHRQFQRLAQFKRLTGITNRWEWELDGFIPLDKQGETKRLINVFRHVAASWYAGELLHESLTREVALKMNEEELPDKGKVLNAAEALIRVYSFSLSDIRDELDRILDPRSEKKMDPDTIKLVSEIAERERQKKPDQKPDKVSEEEKRFQELQANIVDSVKNLDPDSGYVHDSMMDEPSEEAAEYFRNLWERSF